MPSFFRDLGSKAGKAMRQGNWMLQALTGTDAELIAAEETFGRDLAASVRAEMNVPEWPEDLVRSAWLNGLAGELADRLKVKLRKFQVTLVEPGEPNAFALPGGFLFVHRSLLALCEYDRDEVAFVLGHEMAHVVHEHVKERLLGGQGLAQIARAVPIGGPVGMLARHIGLSLVTSAYSRDQELDADRFGVRLAAAAGFAPEGGIRLLGRLQARASAAPGSALDAYFASHPPTGERMAVLRKALTGSST